MSATQLSAVLYGKDDLRMEQTPIPEPGKGEVQVRVHSVGVCGTDIHYWKSGYCVTEDHPFCRGVIGHESSGVVSKLGEGVTGLQIGDRVAIEPIAPCYSCEFCKKGKFSLCVICPLWAPWNGHFRNLCISAADFTHKIPDTISFDEGAILEPLAVGIYACERGEIGVGTSLLIIGAGPVGMVTLLAAKAAGATNICVADLTKSRLDFSKTVGATHTLLVESKDGEAVAKQVHALMGCMPETTIDCSGSAPGIAMGIYATKPGGRLCLAGLAPSQATLPMGMLAVREVDIRPVFRYGPNDTFKRAIEAVHSGVIDVKPLVTHRFPLAKVPEAMEAARTAKDGAVKVIVQCGTE